MKRILMNATLITTIALVGCSSNTQQENTGIGTITGAVVGGLAGSAIGGGTGKIIAVGAGAIVGALLGGSIGHSMDSTDSTKTYSTMHDGQTNQTVEWYNANTHMVYTMTPTSDFFTVDDNSKCRKFHFTEQKKHHHHVGKLHSSNGTACYRNDGTWYKVK